MSSQQNSNKGGIGWLVGIVLLISIFAMIRMRNGSQSVQTAPNGQAAPWAQAPGSPSGPVARALDANNAPLVNPLEAMLMPKNAVARKDGVAAAILVDTSGSMADRVADAGGAKSPKIEIARRAVLKLIQQTADFSKAHPEQNVQVGIYEFSGRDNEAACRQVVALSAPDPDRARPLLQAMRPNGGTPIGDAIVAVKEKLDASGYRRLHILVVTDGDSNRGYAPAEVVAAISRLPEAYRASVYFIAFDVSAGKFRAVRDAGGLVLPAANEAELQQTLDYVLSGKILAEQPPAPGAK